MELISIVVPIYNVSEYLPECIESILNQTYSDIEVILVNDGSTDGSGAICEAYAKKDSRIKVITQKNCGLTVTRRNGVMSAEGRYIVFVDGDDWIEPDMYECLMDYMYNNDVDIVTSAGYRNYSWGQGATKLDDTLEKGIYSMKDDSFLKCLFSASFGTTKHMNGAIWNKLFKKSNIIDVLKKMDDRVNGFMDDNVVFVGTALNSKSIYVTHECKYHHRERNDSFTYSKNPNGLAQINYAYLSLKKLIEDAGYKDRLYGALCEHTSKNMIEAYNSLFDTRELYLPQYVFRSTEIEFGASVLLYGAGKVGKEYYYQLKAENKYNVIGIVDRNAGKIESDFKVLDLNDVRQMKFDYVIIAVAQEEMAEQIKFELEKLNVPKRKMIWEKPITVFEYFR